jgi:Flp pilus assembly protein TadD
MPSIHKLIPPLLLSFCFLALSTSCLPRVVCKKGSACQLAQQQCIVEVNRRQLEKAENYCKLALRYNPNFAEAHNGLGLVALSRGFIKKAERLFRKAIKLKNNFADARSNLGHIFFIRKQYNTARYQFKLALNIDPSLSFAGYNMARTLLQLRQYKDARNQIIQSIFFKKNRMQPKFHYLLGYIEFERKNFRGAVKHWIDTVRIAPGHLKAHLSACKALYQLGQYGYACFHCSHAVRLNPRHIDGKRSLYAVHLMLRKHGKSCNKQLRYLPAPKQ